MRLRAELNKRLPLKQDEQRVGPECRDIIFRGSYFFTKKMVGVDVIKNTEPSSQVDFPQSVRITRATPGGFQAPYSGHVYKNLPESIEDMKSPKALRRATRIENIAHKIKVNTAVGLASLALAATVGLVVSQAETTPTTHKGANAGLTHEPVAGHTYSIAPCNGVVTGHEALLPIGEPAAGADEVLGHKVCKIAGFYFEVIGANESYASALGS